MAEAPQRAAARARRSRRWRAVLLGLAAAVVLVAAAAAAGGYWWLEHEYQSAGPAQAASRFEVSAGASLHGVLEELEASGALRSARAVQWYLRLQGRRPRIEAGAYEIPAHASPAQIVALFEEGKVILEQLTVVEGGTFGDFLEVLAQHPRIQHTLAGKSPAEIMAALGHSGVSPEGQFFPDTYRFAANTEDVTILARAYERMQQLLVAAWEARAPGLPLDNAYQALILASLVEKEAAREGERALIAGVFVNRLRRGMRLQSDPTVIYGLGQEYDGYIHTRDLLHDTAYNTYTRAGLPPTPIALPGRASLAAATQPAQTEALYFVASGLGDGAHHFSSSLEEHNKAVQTYLTRLRGRPAAATAPAPGGAAHPR